ncbi:unnamed protein product [Hyaloperonospora brassicae]|uniref:pectin lyase n=1 Tax=Hyaloperonospora brassicae TaxID=162125 RepID=A0AAV0UY76_HYABA|nr:unnamed protein product [Hyaloperonospora brassicae]
MGRFQRTYAFAAALAFAAKNAAGAFTIGSPSGLGAGTTGGAGGEAVYPTSSPSCMAENNGCKGQDVILQDGGMNNTGGCTNGTEVMVTYDTAGIQRVLVGDNKTIRGIGKNGVLIGKGLSLRNNVIVQNIHITELNPHLGKTVGTNVWIDHVKVSRISRQMVVTNSAGVSGMTVSNSEFDGNTDFSMSCNGHHTWTFLFYEKKHSRHHGQQSHDEGVPEHRRLHDKTVRSTGLEEAHGKKGTSKTDDTYCGMTLTPVHGRDLAKMWAQTTGNFGVGKLD